MSYEINKHYTCLIFKYVRFPKPEIFLELFWTNLQSPGYLFVTHRHNSQIQNVSFVWEMKTKQNKQTNNNGKG